MKTKIKLISVFSLFCFLSAVFAQDVGISSGPIPKLKNERTNITYQSNADLLTAGYAYSATTQSILSASGPCAFNFLAFWSTSDYLSSMCQGGDGKYYVTGTNSPSLYQLDTINVSFELLGNITGMGADEPNGISYNPVDGNYYIASSSNLFSFNVNTRTATLIGPFNTGGIMIDLCFDMNGICYAYDIATDAGYTINISTGNANLLGPLGYDANYGQGMSYDFDTQTIYLTAFNNSTFTGQCRIMDQVTGNTTLLYDWGLEQIDAFALETILSPPCPVGAASNPNPPNGANNIPLTGNTASWTNGAGTTLVEVWFGEVGNLVQVYSGSAISSFSLAPVEPLSYFTDYGWRIVCKNDTCGTQGPTWSFTTMQDPNLFGFCDEFNNLSNWNIIGPLGQGNWNASYTNFAGGNVPELSMSWTPSFNGTSKLRSVFIPIPNNEYLIFQFNFLFDWYADPSGAVTVGITYDGGATSTTLYSITDPTGNVGPTTISGYFISPSSGSQNCQLEITYSGYSFNTDNIYWDNICIYGPIPVELVTFTCEVDNKVVTLFWQTATETNNQGFEIERARLRSSNYAEASWERIGFVEGKGTTTEIQSYSFTDKPEPGMYKYRLKQIDFDGTFAYSPEVEAEVKAPNVFSLEQNYPNPFNPTTKIKYTIPASSLNPFSKGEGTFVTLKVYDILGNEVAALVNEEQEPGVYEVEFSTSSGIRNLVSGIYFYQLKAGSFIETKKMILLK